MRPLARTFVVAALLLLPITATAQTLTIRDLVALNQAGLGDDVLIALIEADGSVFRLSPLDVLELKKQGLSDPLLIKMIQTVKPAPLPPPPAPPRDSHARYDDPDPSPAPRPAAPPPVVVQQTVVQEVRVEAPRQPREREYVQVPVYVPVAVQPRRPVKEPEPVYWGFGGQRRPDSWEPAKTTPDKPKPAGGGGRF
jgi:hypothetical protein